MRQVGEEEFYMTVNLQSRPRLFEGRIMLWINLYPVDNTIRFAITYPLDSDLSIE